MSALHAKCVVVDNRVAFFGSANMTYHGMKGNIELNLIVRDKKSVRTIVLLFEELKGSGLPLGVDKEISYEENVKSGLAEGQIIAIGTDGIWEAFNQDGRMYGKERLRSTIRQYANKGANDILNAVYRDIYRFTSGLKPEDDITLVVIKME